MKSKNIRIITFIFNIAINNLIVEVIKSKSSVITFRNNKNIGSHTLSKFFPSHIIHKGRELIKIEID